MVWWLLNLKWNHFSYFQSSDQKTNANCFISYPTSKDAHLRNLRHKIMLVQWKLAQGFRTKSWFKLKSNWNVIFKRNAGAIFPKVYFRQCPSRCSVSKVFYYCTWKWWCRVAQVWSLKFQIKIVRCKVLTAVEGVFSCVFLWLP